MNLIETKNTLNDCFVGSLKLQNEHYHLTVSYCGDYKEAYKNNTIDSNYISLRCECIDNSIMIANTGLDVYISMSKSFLPDLHDETDWSNVANQINNALITVAELRKIMNKYFGT